MGRHTGGPWTPSPPFAPPPPRNFFASGGFLLGEGGGGPFSGLFYEQNESNKFFRHFRIPSEFQLPGSEPPSPPPPPPPLQKEKSCKKLIKIAFAIKKMFFYPSTKNSINLRALALLDPLFLHHLGAFLLHVQHERVQRFFYVRLIVRRFSFALLHFRHVPMRVRVRVYVRFAAAAERMRRRRRRRCFAAGGDRRSLVIMMPIRRRRRTSRWLKNKTNVFRFVGQRLGSIVES